MKNILLISILSSSLAMASPAMAEGSVKEWCQESATQGAACLVGTLALLAIFASAGDSTTSDADTADVSSIENDDATQVGNPYHTPDYGAAYAGDGSIEDTANGCFWGSIEHGTCQ